MKLTFVVASALICTSLALAANADQNPGASPLSEGQQARVPDMTQMPDSHLQATILFRQNGQDLRVDTAGHPLPNQGTVGKVQPTASETPKSNRMNMHRQSVHHLNRPVMHT